MSAITVKIIYSERVTCREVLEKIRAELPEGFEVTLESAEFGAPVAPTRESVGTELIALSVQMDRVAHNMDELALVHGDDKPEYGDGEKWAIVSHAIELHGAAGSARSWAAKITGE